MKDFFQKDIILENDRIKLMPFHEAYEGGLRRIIFDQEITKYTGNHIISDEDLRNYIRKTLISRENKMSYPFIVIDKRSGEVAGSTRFGNIIFHSKRLEIGWTWCGAAFRGKGINKATKFEMLRYAFEEMDFNRVQFSVDSENIRSQKAVLKLGAKEEGVFRSNYMNVKGEPRDGVYYSVIKSEWDEIKSAVFSGGKGIIN